MTAFINDKRWEVLLGVLAVAVTPIANGLYEAVNTGQFGIANNAVRAGVLLGLVVVGRAFASYRQTPAPTDADVRTEEEQLLAAAEAYLAKHRQQQQILGVLRQVVDTLPPAQPPADPVPPMPGLTGG